MEGLNKDVNVRIPDNQNGSPQYRGFMDLRLLESVKLTDITFSYNTIPSIDGNAV